MKKHFYILCSMILIISSTIYGQQFAGDNQWVAPYGVATLAATVGENYSQFYAIAALIPEWEFNSQFVHYYDDPRTNTDSYNSVSLYAKYRISENEAETAGYSLVGGIGLSPDHLDNGEVVSSFHSWWMMLTATYAFANNSILWDILPGTTVNFDHKQSGKTAWGFTYISRLAIYKIIPHSAIVSEVFGTAGEAKAPLNYRFGVRWESPKWVIAGTYSSAFNKASGAGFELGVIFFTEPLFGSN